jgi:hypothetical protein
MFFSEKDHKYYKKNKGDFDFLSASGVVEIVKPKYDIKYWSLYKAYEFQLYYEHVDNTITLEDTLNKENKKLREKLKENFKAYKAKYRSGDYAIFKHLRMYADEKVVKKIQRLILAYWETDKLISLDKGSEYHKFEEDYAEFKGKLVNPYSGSTLPVINCNEQLNSDIKKRSVDIVNLPNGIYNELIVNFDKYIGQIDRLYLEYRNFWIKDFKTNKEIKFENRFGKMKYPVSHLDDCNWNHYCIQLGLYIWILTQLGYNFQKAILQHCVYNEKTNTWTKKDYEVPYLKREIEDIINEIYYKEHLL